MEGEELPSEVAAEPSIAGDVVESVAVAEETKIEESTIESHVEETTPDIPLETAETPIQNVVAEAAGAEVTEEDVAIATQKDEEDKVDKDDDKADDEGDEGDEGEEGDDEDGKEDDMQQTLVEPAEVTQAPLKTSKISETALLTISGEVASSLDVNAGTDLGGVTFSRPAMSQISIPEAAELESIANSSCSEEERISLSLTESEHIPTLIDRDPYIMIYKTILKDYGLIKRQNNFLQKKMTEYFKKRKMEHVLRETEHIAEVLLKYKHKLDLYRKLIEEDAQHRQEITEELNEMHAIKTRQIMEVTKNFKDMVAKERETGTGLILSKTGKEIPEKLLDRLLQNQKSKTKELESLRLSFIKVRNAVTEKHLAIRALDKIGDNWSLMEFEQLKMENQGHTDKIEERDEELTRLRAKCSGGIQCLAHIREKCSAISININETKLELEKEELVRAVAREKVNEIKHDRDCFRTQEQKLKQASGLLLKPKLLIDMEHAMKEIEVLEKQITIVEEKYRKNKRFTKAIKFNFEMERKKQAAMKLRVNTRRSSRRTTLINLMTERSLILTKQL